MLDWLLQLMPHLIAIPIILPLFTAILLLIFNESYRKTQIFINLISCILGLLIAIALFIAVKFNEVPVISYALGGWAPPFGIVLVADSLSTMMLVLNSILILCSLLFASARWIQAGVYYHALFQFFIMGLSGAFLTGDLFNLFVFFEIMLAASYGLMLHGSGKSRVVYGMHYIVINLVASSFFLIGAAVVYGVTGTLNMADITYKLWLLASEDLSIFNIGVTLLGVAFLIKAAMWPLNFWLVPAYSNAVAPVAAAFVIMTKVGIYVILRLTLLFFSDQSGITNRFQYEWLVYGGLLTLFVATFGLLSTQRVGRQAAYSAVISAGILLTVLSFAEEKLTANTLYYLLNSSLAVSLLFLISDLLNRWRYSGSSFSSTKEAEEVPFLTPDLTEEKMNLDEYEIILRGKAIPASTAFMGISFLCATLLIAGMPPLSGFLAKIGIFLSLFEINRSLSGFWSNAFYLKWIFLGLLILSSIFTMISMTRSGIRNFWASHDRPILQLRWLEGIPVAILLVLCILLSVRAEDVIRYTHNTAHYLYQPSIYINAVLHNNENIINAKKKVLNEAVNEKNTDVDSATKE